MNRLLISNKILNVVLFVICFCIASIAIAGQQPGNFKQAQRFNAAGQLIGSISPDPDGSGPLKYLATRYIFDAHGRLKLKQTGSLTVWADETVAPQNWEGYGFKIYMAIEHHYDVYGRKSKDVKYGENGVIEALKEYTYDSRSRIDCKITRMDPNNFNALLGQASNCNLSAQGSFGLDRIVKYEYNGLDQVIVERREWGGPRAYVIHKRNTYISSTITVDFGSSVVTDTYYGEKLNTETDGNGNLTQYTYDDLKRLKRIIFPSKTLGAGVANTTPESTTGDYIEYTYDANGNMKTERKRNGNLFSYNYDNTNKLINKDAPGTSLDVVYDYDLRGLTKYARFGSINGDGVTNTYDGFGNLMSSSNKLNNFSRNISYQHDLNNNLNRITHPDGKYFEYFYDYTNRLNQITEQGSVLNWVDYDDAGRRAKIDRNASRGGAATAYSYDNASRLRVLQQNLAGTANDLANTFSYNPANQVSNLHMANDQYYYRGNENLTGNYVVNGLNQYTSINSSAITYDTKGNLQNDGVYTYVYDDENRLTSVSGQKSATLKYDPLGRLVEITVNGITRQFLYDQDVLIGEFSANSLVPVARYVYGSGVDEPLVQYFGNLVGESYRRYIHSDHTGSVIAHTDTNGNVLSTNAYDNYGIPAATNVGRHGFTGQIWISELGLNYYKARMYHPKLGRFLQTDPIGYKDGMNWYTYVGNDPVNNIDPTGMFASGAYFPNPAMIDLYGIDGTQDMLEAHDEAGEGAVVILTSAGGGALANGARVAYRAYSYQKNSDTPVKELTTQQQKSIRSLERQIEKHEQKIKNFKDNPTVRPGMEKMSKEKIEAQQQRRVNHLEKEIKTFRENIEKIKNGEIDS